MPPWPSSPKPRTLTPRATLAGLPRPTDSDSFSDSNPPRPEWIYTSVPREGPVKLSVFLYLTAVAFGQTRVAIDNDDIGGVVSSAKGPEAGVWVIAETTSLPTKFAKIVTTDDRGR